MAVDVRCNMFKAGARALAFFLFLAEIAESAERVSPPGKHTQSV